MNIQQILWPSLLIIWLYASLYDYLDKQRQIQLMPMKHLNLQFGAKP